MACWSSGLQILNATIKKFVLNGSGEEGIDEPFAQTVIQVICSQMKKPVSETRALALVEREDGNTVDESTVLVL